MNDSDAPGESRLPSTEKPDTGKNRRPGARRGRPRRFGYYFKWAVISGLLLLFVAVGTVAGVLYKRSSLIRTILDGNNIQKTIITLDPYAPYRTEENFPGLHTMNILVLGCDSDYVEHVDHPIVVKGAPGRSDAIMVAHIDFDKKTVNVLSIPRDTAVPIPGLRGYHKVNAAHSLGGNDLSTKTISQDFGIHIDHTISLDFDSFQKVVDSVGGVDVTIHKNLDYDDNWASLHIHLKPGPQHLDGYHAMGYVRIRHSDNDLARAERQHEFLEALRARVKDPSNFGRLPDAVNAITDDIKSDLSLQQMLSLVHFATPLPRENIHLATMEGFEGRSYVYAYPDKAQEIIGKLFYDGNSSAVKLDVAPHDIVVALNSRGRRVRTTHGRKHRTHASDAGTRRSLRTATPDSSGTPPASEATDRHIQNGDNGHSTGGDDNKSGGHGPEDDHGARANGDGNTGQANILASFNLQG